MLFRITKNNIIFSSEDNSSLPVTRFKLHSKACHIIRKFFHRFFPSIATSEKAVLEEGKIIYVNTESYQKWRSGRHGKEIVMNLNPIFFSVKSTAIQLRTIINYLKEKKFFDPNFNQLVAREIALAIDTQNQNKLKKIFSATERETLHDALRALDKKKGINLLAYAAHHNNSLAVSLIRDYIDENFLYEILIQKDKHQWTALHHLALMNDNGILYKELKRKAHVNTKTVTSFFCESPSMLRKYIRKDAGHFSTLSTKHPAYLYFRDGLPQQRSEQHLPFKSFMQQHRDHFSIQPKHFKMIPQVKPEALKRLWIDMKHPILRNEARLLALDQHLRNIQVTHGETGVALTPIKYNDRDEKLPEEIPVGLGVEARRDFRSNEIVTLYGGEYSLPHHPLPSPGGSYAYGTGNPSEVIDGIDFRSYGSTFIHSAPNTTFENIHTNLGITIVAMTAIEEIHEREQLCESYGMNYFKSRGIVPLETRPEARKRMQEHPSNDAYFRAIQQGYLNIGTV